MVLFPSQQQPVGYLPLSNAFDQPTTQSVWIHYDPFFSLEYKFNQSAEISMASVVVADIAR